ncbi:hypothetical protein HPB50_020138 [Hyalomma asiaticum]|uniref:Uncharacterized protein n=1 Tax=Hyalomma asiaticum TaxID=266040 RepID=A0ACB7RPT1_HYAAI|nr:hypothetical protein HPB50_020138 [Hyalomma asiaticum]
MDASTGAIAKRPRKTKVKAMLPFGSTSTGNRSSPCHLRASFTDLIALLEEPHKGEGKHRSVLTINATEDTGLKKSTATGRNCPAPSALSSTPSDHDCETATSTVVDHESSVPGDDQAVTSEEEGPSGVAEMVVLGITRHRRQRTHKEPLQEHDLIEFQYSVLGREQTAGITEQEIRNHLPKSRGGSSGMTYNEIVPLVLDRFDSLAEETEEREDISSNDETYPQVIVLCACYSTSVAVVNLICIHSYTTVGCPNELLFL